MIRDEVENWNREIKLQKEPQPNKKKKKEKKKLVTNENKLPKTQDVQKCLNLPLIKF